MRATRPIPAAVITTPAVASKAEGQMAMAMKLRSVFNPPLNRIMVSARLPRKYARLKSLKPMPTRPSRPASMPRHKKTSSNGAFTRLATTLATIAAIPRIPIKKMLICVVSTKILMHARLREGQPVHSR
jgi:hypothetical protein